MAGCRGGAHCGLHLAAHFVAVDREGTSRYRSAQIVGCAPENCPASARHAHDERFSAPLISLMLGGFGRGRKVVRGKEARAARDKDLSLVTLTQDRARAGIDVGLASDPLAFGINHTTAERPGARLAQDMQIVG